MNLCNLLTYIRPIQNSFQIDGGEHKQKIYNVFNDNYLSSVVIRRDVFESTYGMGEMKRQG